MFVAENNSLYPPDVIAFFATFTEDICSQNLGIDLPEALRFAVPKRKAEFIASRICVRRAFEKMSSDFQNFILLNGNDRAPIWPLGFVGSITHTQGFTAAAIASNTSIRSIGLDAEKIIEHQTVAEIKELIATPSELVRFCSDWEEDLLVSLLFTAKECIYKCLYPLVRKIFEFQNVEIETLEIGRPEALMGQFSARILIPLDSEFGPGSVLNGQFKITDGIIHTVVILRVTPNESPASKRAKQCE